MLMTTRHHAQTWIRILALLLASATTGCGTWVTISAAQEEEQDLSSQMTPETMVVSAPPNKDGDASAGARQFALMALFAQTVYHKHLPHNQRNDPACRMSIAAHPVGEIDIRDAQTAAAWRRWDHDRGCFSANGVFYEVYVLQQAGGPIQKAVIAFRGTENYSAQAWYDWSSNVDTALGVPAPEYVQAQYPMLQTLAALHQASPGVKIYLTGHSLGGGLAQQGAYMADHGQIDGTYVFNTSPVTNWSRLKREGKIGIGSDDPRIYRIQERGEGNGLLRWVSSRVNFRRFGRSDHEFNFSQGNPVSSHSMSILACNFAARVLNTGADHDYTPDMARRVLLHRTKAGAKDICPDGVLSTIDRRWTRKLEPGN